MTIKSLILSPNTEETCYKNKKISGYYNENRELYNEFAKEYM